jgi:hypothetical protein
MENLESISRAILPLSLESKKHLLEILEQQIFELEEANYKDDQKTVEEIKSVQKEYEKGEYLTLDQYLQQRTKINQ